MLNRLISMSTIPPRVDRGNHAQPVRNQCTTSAEKAHK